MRSIGGVRAIVFADFCFVFAAGGRRGRTRYVCVGGAAEEGSPLLLPDVPSLNSAPLFSGNMMRQ